MKKKDIVKLDDPDDMLPEYDLRRMRIIKRGPGYALKSSSPQTQVKEKQRLTASERAIIALAFLSVIVNVLPIGTSSELIRNIISTMLVGLSGFLVGKYTKTN